MGKICTAIDRVVFLPKSSTASNAQTATKRNAGIAKTRSGTQLAIANEAILSTEATVSVYATQRVSGSAFAEDAAASRTTVAAMRGQKKGVYT